MQSYYFAVKATLAVRSFTRMWAYDRGSMKAGEGGGLVCTFPRVYNLLASCQNIMSVCLLLRDFGSHSPSLAHMCYLGLGLWRLSDGAN